MEIEWWELFRTILCGIPALFAVTGIVIAGIYVPGIVYAWAMLAVIVLLVCLFLGALVRKFLLKDM